MSFQKFNKFNSRSSDIYANISSNNAINFSSGFGEANGIAKFKYAVLYYDKKDAAIGVKFTNDTSEKSKFVAGKKKASSGVSIIAHSYFKHNGISAEKYGKTRYIPHKVTLRDAGIDETGTMFVIRLRDKA